MMLSKRIILVLVVTVLIGMGIRISDFAQRGLTDDEKYHLSYRQSSFMETVKQMPRMEFSSLMTGHVMVTYPFAKWGADDKWAVAIPRLLILPLTFWYLFLTVRSLNLSPSAYVTAFCLFSFNQTLIFHSMEIRPYAFLILLGMMSFVHMKVVMDGALTHSKKWLYGALFLFILLFHTHGILMLFFSFLFWLIDEPLWEERWLKVKRVLKMMWAPAMIALPVMLYCFFGQHMAFFADAYTFRWIPNPYQDAAGFFRAVVGNLLGYKLWWVLLPALPVALVLSASRLRLWGFWLMMVILPLIFILILHIKTDHWFVQRFFIWVFPFFIVALSWAVAVILDRLVFKGSVNAKISA